MGPADGHFYIGVYKAGEHTLFTHGYGQFEGWKIGLQQVHWMDLPAPPDTPFKLGEEGV